MAHVPGQSNQLPLDPPILGLLEGEARLHRCCPNGFDSSHNELIAIENNAEASVARLIEDLDEDISDFDILRSKLDLTEVRRVAAKSRQDVLIARIRHARTIPRLITLRPLRKTTLKNSWTAKKYGPDMKLHPRAILMPIRSRIVTLELLSLSHDEQMSHITTTMDLREKLLKIADDYILDPYVRTFDVSLSRPRHALVTKLFDEITEEVRKSTPDTEVIERKLDLTRKILFKSEKEQDRRAANLFTEHETTQISTEGETPQASELLAMGRRHILQARQKLGNGLILRSGDRWILPNRITFDDCVTKFQELEAATHRGQAVRAQLMAVVEMLQYFNPEQGSLE